MNYQLKISLNFSEKDDPSAREVAKAFLARLPLVESAIRLATKAEISTKLQRLNNNAEPTKVKL